MKILHTLMGVALTVTLGLYGAFIGHPWLCWVGALVTVGFFAGREIAQAEYRWIERFGGGLRASMGLLSIWTTPGIWSEKSWMWDWALPSLVVVLLALYHPELLALLPRLPGVPA